MNFAGLRTQSIYGKSGKGKCRHFQWIYCVWVAFQQFPYFVYAMLHLKRYSVAGPTMTAAKMSPEVRFLNSVELSQINSSKISPHLWANVNDDSLLLFEVSMIWGQTCQL